jgi:phage shock protein A
MPLISRVTRLFRSDLHAVLDSIEEPHILLKQAVREMADSIAEDELRFKLLTHEQLQLTSRKTELNHTFEQLEEELDICFDSGKEDLARSLIKRKLEAQRLAKVMANKHNMLESTLTQLNTRLEENRSRLISMQQKVDILSEQNATNSENNSHAEPWNVTDVTDVTVSNEDIEVAFLREQQKRVSS